jgi:hypothetical protein
VQALHGVDVEYSDVCALQDQPMQRTFIILDDDNVHLDKMFTQVHQSSDRPVAGILECRNFCFAGNEALPLHFSSGTCLIGHSLGWSLRQVQFVLESDGFLAQRTEMTSPTTFELNLATNDWQELAPGILLTAPGQDIYGHWIIDFLTRLHVLRKAGRSHEQTVYLNVVPQWTAGFLRAFGVESKALHRMANKPVSCVKTVQVPTFTKRDSKLGYPIFQHSVKSFVSYMLELGLSATQPNRIPIAPKLFVARSGSITRASLIANTAEIERHAVQCGFCVVHPEMYSVREQVHIFHRARIIVGEDGSALHNIAFAEPGCILGVLSESERDNLWHAGVCSQMGHQVAYLRAIKSTDDNEFITLGRFDEFLKRLTEIADEPKTRIPARSRI